MGVLKKPLAVMVTRSLVVVEVVWTELAVVNGYLERESTSSIK